MTGSDDNPYIKSLDMSLSEATEKFGSLVLVAIGIASGSTQVTDSTWRVYDVEKRTLAKKMAEYSAIQDLIMQKLA